MSERKNIWVLAGFVLSVSLLTASFTAVFLTDYYSRTVYHMLGVVCQEAAENHPEAEQAVISALKHYKYEQVSLEDENILSAYGYQQTDFLRPAGKYSMVLAAAGFLPGGMLFLLTLFFRHRKEMGRIRDLTDYLEKVNDGCGGVLLRRGEDAFSKLQDEIYKTVTELYQTRDMALKAKNNFAENLYNIAHQIKTPLTAMSLSLQMAQGASVEKLSEQIRRQISRLTYLEENLLLLSRIDSGALVLERKQVDVFTLLELSADNLQELFQEAEVMVRIPEAEEAAIWADMEWTMEAVMNLLKNCMEHTPPGGVVCCSYEQNPLYTRIRIWDNGAGFAKEDIPYLFERFYRGRNAKKDGLGIGLALSRAIIEGQNGTLSAGNLPEGGACFEIRLYEA